ncbi:helix-turn-helix transcriptional regulator [Paenibacillus melissococcoides]|uniref:Helix-turn-helix transcriptional regulator n=1 Tax=Paenibacillus melissococcoides TaxID=2912268 RepID=A0ABM9GCC0_9BACL|nr:MULTISPECIES: helix-turn-helix transcriptional regulator [Paenibacillus]MEB9894172.1 helix-turn-helix transcriptional regulator [Bacillus cereus]GIO79485.1 hypothetical protein J6TS7_30950 [Paenibacillus dendritiformis]CAH8249751.1 helix-turn-helix transcriptional regulator [Paenibacillus melissococcoides]CAH8721809.1 helix-turn-helix transcriptional regulator [Paenibacillus melissococcoides]
MDIIQKIEKLMDQRKMTKYRLAKESGLPQSTITSIMSGRIKNPSIESLTKIADALDVPISHFLGFDQQYFEIVVPNPKDDLSEIDEDVRALAREIQDLDSGDKDLLKAMIKTMRDRGREARDR